ncbi:aromatic ring-opening dioxygenase LigB subunit [Pilobolus umbonatus]|nr:aromatic ring-opening dioxygenase LigB subunit [Pilobolus umbonatus]
MTVPTKTPVFFISHGGPNLLDDQEKPGHFYTWLGNYIQNVLKPTAIVIMSAHWQGTGKDDILVDISEKPKLIYDFYNFPKHYYDQKWDHKGSPAVAQRVIELINKTGYKARGLKYGNDHGVWVPLKRAMDSNPNIPVIEISTFSHEDMSMHAKVGQALAPLREEGVLIIGSGSAVHNLREIWSYSGKGSPNYANEFDKELENIACKHIGDERISKAVVLDKNKHYRSSHPTAEHLMPYHFALGAAGEDTGKKLIHDFFATISWSSFGFGLPSDTTLPNYQNVNRPVKDEF